MIFLLPDKKLFTFVIIHFCISMKSNTLSMNKKQQLEHIVKSGFALLEEKQNYGQVNIIRKLKSLHKEISPAALNKIIKGNGGGQQALGNAGAGILQIIEQELGYIYDESTNHFINTPDENWKPYIIPENESESNGNEIKKTNPNTGAVYHSEGRLPIQDKVAFMQQAQKNIIEVGIRLHTFSDYFTSRSGAEFRGPVEELLQKGVNFTAYLIDPDSNESRIYFNDREKIQKGEAKGTEVIKTVVEQLKNIKADLIEKNYTGQFEVFSYKHIPYNHFLVIDGDKPFGQMMISHYIYGVRRADCPVITFSCTDDPSLYERYWQSLQAFIKDAKKLV